MENHETIQQLLVDFVLGQLSQEQCVQVRQHLANCPLCSEELKKLRNLLQLTSQIRASSASEELCVSAKDRLLETVSKEQPEARRTINLQILWSKIMRNKITSLAAAAVLLIIGAIAVATFNNSQPQPITDETIVTETSESDIVLEKQLQHAEQLFAAGDTKGLLEILSSGQYPAKVAAANYLAQLADADAITPLEEMASKYQEAENPFALAAEKIKKASVELTVPVKNLDYLDANAVSSEIFELLPANTLFCLRINNFDNALGQMDKYLSGIASIQIPASMGGRGLMANILADAPLTNVDTKGDFALAGLAISGDPYKQSINDLLIVVLVPMKDYNKFIAENPNVTPADANGVSVITMGNRKTLITGLGNYGLTVLVGDYNKLHSAVNMSVDKNTKLSDLLGAEQLLQIKQQPFWAYTNIQKSSSIFTPVVKQKLVELKKMIAAMNQPAPVDAVKIYSAMYDILTQEVESMSLSIKPTDKLLSITFNATAMPYTPMARMFTADTADKKQNKLLGFIPDSSMSSLALRLNTPFWEELSLSNYDIISMMSDTNIPDKTFDNLQNHIIDMISSASGDSVMSWDFQNDPNGTPFAATWVAEVNNIKKWRQANDDLMQLWGQSTFGKIYEENFQIHTDYQVVQDADNYLGVPIDATMFSMTVTDPNSEYSKVIKSIYGQGIQYRMAYTDGLYLCSIGNNSRQGIRDLIDKVKNGIDSWPRPEFAAAMQLLDKPEQCDFIGIYNHVRVLNMAKAFMPPEISSALTGLELTSKSNLAFGGKVGAGRMNVEIVMPKEHLLEIVSLGKAMNKAIIQQKRAPKQDSGQLPIEPNTIESDN